MATAAVGVKDSVKMYNDIKNLTVILEQYNVTMDDLDIESPKSQIGQMAQKIFQENQIFDNCKVNFKSILQQKICKNKQIRHVSSIATSIVYSDTLKKTSERIQELSKKLANSQDAKESSDIGNAISIELANLEISKSRVAMMEKANAAKSKMDQDRLAQEKSKTLGDLSDKSSWFK